MGATTVFELKGQAEIKNINLRVEQHGDEMVRAMDLKLVIASTDATKLVAASDHMDTFFEKGEPKLQEFYPLAIPHKIENLGGTLKAGRKTIKILQCDAAKVKIKPLYGSKAEVRLTLKISPMGDIDVVQLHSWLRAVVKIDLEERQLDLPAMDQPTPIDKNKGKGDQVTH